MTGLKAVVRLSGAYLAFLIGSGFLPEGVSIKDECHDRRFTGDGQFPNVTLVSILADTGGLNGGGPEVFSPMLKAMSAGTVARPSAESMRAVLAAAGVVD